LEHRRIDRLPVGVLASGFLDHSLS
jgi:hypothetical protein